MTRPSSQRGGIISGLLKFILVMQILLVLVLFGYHYSRKLLDVYFNRGEIPVPSLTGKSLGDALEIAQESGLSVMIVEKRHSRDVAENFVISQTPDTASKVRRGRRIQVVLSMGAFLVATPEVIGKPFRTAGIILRNESFSIGKVAYINDDRVPVDMVIAQNPRENSMVARNASVDLLVSLGKAEHMIQVPDFIGLSLDDAKGKLTRAGLLLGKVSYTLERGESRDVVLAQLPKKGLVVDMGSTVDLLVNGIRPVSQSGYEAQTHGMTPGTQATEQSYQGNFSEGQDYQYPSQSQVPAMPGFDGSLESGDQVPQPLEPAVGTVTADGYQMVSPAGQATADQAGAQSEPSEILGESLESQFQPSTPQGAIFDGQPLQSGSARALPQPTFGGGLESDETPGHAEDFGYFSSSMKKNVSLEFVVPEKGKRSRVQMVLIDTKGISKIYDNVHSGGEKLSIEATGYGKVKILIYVNRALVLQRNY